ncbi:MAG: hypothetical protein O3A63_21380 [Proteobacteria bacterium]|nr:hypothetical protein [Pseudomonadota bacterium]
MKPELTRLTRQFARAHPDEFADRLASADVAQITAVLAALPEADAVAVVLQLPLPVVETCIRAVSDEILDTWLRNADLGDAFQLSNRIAPRSRRARLVRGVEDEHRRKQLLTTLDLRSGSVGALADPDFVRLSGSLSLGDCVATFRSIDASQGKPILIVDEHDELLGYLNTLKALCGSPAATLKTCIDPVRALPAESTLETALGSHEWSVHTWLPVVDRQRHLMGLVSHVAVVGFASDGQASAAPPPVVEIATSYFDTLTNLTLTLLGEEKRGT